MNKTLEIFKSEVIAKLKGDLKKQSAVSVSRTIEFVELVFRKDNPNFQLVVNQPLVEIISNDIISDGKYERQTKGNDYYITIKKDFRKWSERHPGWFAFGIAVISGIISLIVGLLLQRSENREYKILEQRVQTLSDSVTILQKHTTDSAKHK